MIARAIAAAGVSALVLLSTVAAASVPKPKENATAKGPAQTLQTKDFRIETDETQMNYDSGAFTMPHHVKFLRPGTDVVGDRAHGNFKDDLVTITGHVVLHDSGSSPEARQAGAPPGNGPATLECDELQIDSRRKVYIATGNVHFVQGINTANAQNGRLDQGAHTLDLSGNVHLTQGATTFSGDSVHYDTLTKDVNSTGNPIIITEPATQPFGHQNTPTPKPKK